MAEQKFNWVDNPTSSGVAKCDTDILNDCLMHLKYDNAGSSAYVGQTIFSLDPLYEDGLHLLDGTELKVGGIYDQFINTYIANLYKNAPQRFCTEAEWQASVEQYGVCGKYVYTPNVSVRLPKVSNYLYTEPFAETASVVGNGMALGLTDGTNNFGVSSLYANGNSLYGVPNGYGTDVGSTPTINQAPQEKKMIGLTNDPTKSGIEADLSNITTPLEGYYYIVVATSTKTDIEVDIDNIVTELNQKVDISNMVEVPTIIEVSDPSLMPSWYRVYSDGWCEQGGYYVPIATTGTIALLKAYKDTNYSITTGVNRATATTLYSPCVASTKIVSSFSVYVDNTANNIYWRTSGYIT